MTYRIIYADPPWDWKAYSAKGENRSAKRHYPVMSLDDIKRLEVGSIADENSVLLLWATDPFLEKAFEVINAWGFKYKTVGFYWVKLNKTNDNYFMGNGYHTRANPETCLLATKGKGIVRISKSIERLVVARRGRHSEKPDCVRTRIEQLYGDVPRVELFARKHVQGWNCWGNEIESNTTLLA